MGRDWRPMSGTAGLPLLTGAAQQLVDDFSRAHPAPGDGAAWRPSAGALRILVSWLGADAPFHEADVRALTGLRAGFQVRRVLTFLVARGTLIPIPRGRPSLPSTPHTRCPHPRPARSAARPPSWSASCACRAASTNPRSPTRP